MSDVVALRASLRQRLADVSVSDLPPGRALVTIPPNCSLVGGFQLLLDNKLLSAPVEKPNGDSGYAGFLDIRSLASSVVGMYREHEQRAALGNSVELGDAVAALSMHGKKAGQDHMDVWTPAYVAKINPMRTVRPSATLAEVCDLLTRGARRVVVVDENGVALRVVSQSWLMDVLFGVVSALDSELSVRELGIKPGKVYSVSLSQPAVEAFELMDKHGIHGVPVVDGEGRLVGQLTAADLSNFLIANRGGELMRLHAKLQVLLPEASLDQGKALALTESSTLRDLFQRFAATKSHRLFLVDSKQRVLGVCSLRDALLALLG